jgi:glutathione synthase
MLKILSVMDPLERLELAQDTTVGFINSATRRGAEVDICTPESLFLVGDQAWARAQSTRVSEDHIEVLETRDRPLSDYDCVWMRKDPPVDQAYLHATYLLDFANTWVINPPSQLRAANEKLYALRFLDATPDTRVSSSPDQVMEWLQASESPLIVKPLDGYGGLGVCLLSASDRNSRVTLELLTDHGRRRVVVQRYLPEARRGDHRVIIINGEVIGAILRTPQEDDHRGNIHVGGQVSLSPLDEAELALCERVARQLKEDGVFFAGIDLIGGMLTEINITSPTGIRELKALTGVDAGDLFIEAIEREVLRRGEDQ